MVADHPLDECRCGDYRRDHKDGVGPCNFNDGGRDLCHGMKDCRAFSLAARYAGEACRACGEPIPSAELCARCAAGNDPFRAADNCGADLRR